MHDLLTAYPALFLSTAGIFGLLIGSFLNVVIIRLPRRMMFQWREQCHEYLQLDASSSEQKAPPPGIVVEPSHCVHCQHPLGALENIPLISYLFLMGRCRWCQAKISIRYPLVELITAIATLTVAWHFGPTLAAIWVCVLSWSLIALTGIDIDHQLLPDPITLPLLWLGLIVNLHGAFAVLGDAVLGAAIGYISLWSVYHAFRLLTGKEGMGHGDFKLTAALGAWMGWQMLPLIILLASFSGAMFGLIMIALGRQQRETPFPFGPYLALAGWIAMLWGQSILDSYFAAFGQ